MGEKPTGRFVVLAGLLLASLFVGMASADQDDITFLVEVQDVPNQPWFTPEDPLVLAPSLVNNGPEVSLLVNPTCPYVINAYNATGVLVVDGTDACPDREQGLDLFAGERMDFEPVVWSMRDNDGNWLEGGVYTVELVHSAGFNHQTTVQIQTPVSLPDGLTYSVEKTQRTALTGPNLYMVNLHNPTAQSVDVSVLPSCAMEIVIDAKHRLGSSCTSDVNSLMPGEVILVEQFTANMGAAVSIATPGKTLDYSNQAEVATPSLPSSFDIAIDVNRRDQPTYGPGDVLSSQLLLSNVGDAPSVVEFTSSCKAEMWIVDDLGRVVYDTRQGKECTEIDLEVAIQEGDSTSLSLPQWGFDDGAGCVVESGVFTLVAEVPELGLATSRMVEYHSSEVNPCVQSDSATVEASLTWQDEQTVLIATSITGANNQHVRMAQSCTYEIEFLDGSGQVAHGFQTLCDAYDGRKILFTEDSSPLKFSDLEIDMIQNGDALLPEGYYTLKITLLSSSTTSTSLPVVWPANHGEEEPIVNEEAAPEPYEIIGTWVALQTGQGTCHVLNMDDTSYLLSNARTLPTWAPNSEVQGLYVVVDAARSPACGDGASPSVEVVEVRMEQPLEAEAEVVLAAVPEPSEGASEQSPVVVTATVIITASLFSLFVVAAATNEGLRLPATAAGLWLFGLIGKTHETTDGRYQRGRLMGYLTANPGCHFRALMNALDMSNGQITHHLRVLEGEEHVWRKSDGRLVRFYPLTNQLNPSTRDEDLPIPPLSPDPNSLQGKILNLLDQDGGMGEFPTQAELAKRLEKSQQLISHHLRTLQKYGLVERRKMGVKNRYKLTREAVFLLETSADFAKNDIV